MSNDTGSSTTFRVIIASALSLPKFGESIEAFRRILYTPGFVGVPLIVCVEEL